MVQILEPALLVDSIARVVGRDFFELRIGAIRQARVPRPEPLQQDEFHATLVRCLTVVRGSALAA